LVRTVLETCTASRFVRVRWVLLLGVVWVLAFAHVAGSASSSRYVLWSTRTASLPAAPARLLPADLPDDTRRGASADVLDRTTGGRLAVAALDEVVIENVDGSARAAVPVAGVYDARFSPDGSLLVLASMDCPSRDYRCENLSVVDSDGGNLHQISSNAGAARWLDDRTLAFVGDVSAAGVGTLELADPSGRVARTLGRSFSYPYPAPAPSPNGQLIVGQCRAQLVCVIGAGSVKRVVARFKGALVETPLWSPDGRRIALTLAGTAPARPPSARSGRPRSCRSARRRTSAQTTRFSAGHPTAARFSSSAVAPADCSRGRRRAATRSSANSSRRTRGIA